MKFTTYDLRFTVSARERGFTMIEIAFCLAIIGIALVAIIGVLPLGMNTQRENREQTVINQDATVFIEAIRNGTRGLDDLTNYVYEITNTVTRYANWNSQAVDTYDYTYVGSTHNGNPMSPQFPINNGERIIGLLSMPEYTDLNGKPISDFSSGDFYQNHVIAYVRSMSGPAVEKPPQDNDILRENSFSYHLFCVNSGLYTNFFMAHDYSVSTNLFPYLHDLRLTFQYPVRPNGKLGLGRLTFRTLAAGQIIYTNTSPGYWLYFYQSQTFTNAL